MQTENKMQPLVSVIVPVYNLENLLPKCVDSILHQTYTNLELLLVDDGSCDGSLALCRKYAEADSRVRVFQKENGGQGTARNLALDHMQGEFIAFVDADDYVLPEMLQTMVTAALENDAQMAICGAATENAVRLVDTPVFDTYRVLDTKELLREYVTTGNILTVPWNKLYRAELFDGLRFPAFRSNEDAYIMHELLGRCKRAVHVGKCLYVQYIRPGSTEQSGVTEKNLALLECAQALTDYFEKNFPDMLELVAYKKADDAAALLMRMLSCPKRLRDGALYEKLHETLLSSYAEASSRFPNSRYIRKTTQLAVKSPLRFRLLCMYRRVRRRLVRTAGKLRRSLRR